MIIESSIKGENIHIYSIELVVTYSIYEQLVEIKRSTIETDSPSLSILDKEPNNNQAVDIKLTNLKEINKLINNFNKKFKKLTK